MSHYKNNPTRRKFIKQLGGSAALMTGATSTFAGSRPFHILKRRQKISANDRITIASIGMGIMGFGDTDTALQQEGIELIGVADCYQGHLKYAQEKYGKDIKVTMNYQELLNDESIDAVIIATPDHWHDRIAVEAMQKGKAVYCEKPMVQHIDEGHKVIKAQKQTKVPFQVGSQYASSIAFLKAKELYEQGMIGELNFAEVYYDRFSALGAWQYSIPPDASPETCDWKMFQGDASDIPFDATRFFRWRNYRDYGTGIPGDLFVHLFTMLHLITGSQGPNRIYTTGGLRYWEDGRDVADVMVGLYDYPKTETHPAFNLSLRVNFVDGSGGGQQTRLVGTEGEMVLDPSQVIIRRKKLSKAPGYGGWDTYNTFPKEMKEQFEKQYQQEYSNIHPEIQEPKEMAYQTPEGYDMRADHFADWFNVIRNGGETVEGAEFGLRAAGPALASNISHYENRLVGWDPETMQLTDSSKAVGQSK
uniref:Gfo/Idh/MocA family oxidoreductase n=1 Tax=Roseihalotalea indica TaxID=2867963 RepID=A0AA49GKH6_9BACT|nr:Gfo/Idh/MocA family oxidoreductase [Tunicatimonas sp. TK19036]